MVGEKGLKRQRVSKACEKCRLLKAKVNPSSCHPALHNIYTSQCDGQQPVCGRCTGYGFTCVWSSSRSRSIPQPGGSRVIDQSTLRSIVASYEALVMNLKERLDERQRSDIEASHAYIQSHLPLRFSSSNESQVSETSLPLRTHTYVGTASDTHFFNTIKHAMSANSETSKYRTDTERYDQPDSLRGIPRIRKPLKLPSAKLCHQYLDIFFSTIHCAFPFLSRSTVEERLGRISADGASDTDPSWTAQLSMSMSTPKLIPGLISNLSLKASSSLSALSIPLSRSPPASTRYRTSNTLPRASCSSTRCTATLRCRMFP